MTLKALICHTVLHEPVHGCQSNNDAYKYLPALIVGRKGDFCPLLVIVQQHDCFFGLLFDPFDTAATQI